MSLPLITPQQAKARVAEGGRLIDIRDTDEYARAHMSGAEPPYPADLTLGRVK